VRTLIEHDLVDEMRLKIFPLVLVAGLHLFGETAAETHAPRRRPDPRVTVSSLSPAKSFEVPSGWPNGSTAPGDSDVMPALASMPEALATCDDGARSG
jgi:hypothetical protein